MGILYRIGNVHKPCIIKTPMTPLPLRDFFRPSTPSDRLNFIQQLLESNQLNLFLALALLKVIHHELIVVQTPDRSVYKKYARVIEAFRYKKAELLNQVADAWKTDNASPEQDPEWLSRGVIK